MAVWLQGDKFGEAVPTTAARVALALLENRSPVGLEPLLLPSVPAVDGVVRLNGRRSAGLTPECLTYDHLISLRPGENLLVSHGLQAIRRTAQRTTTSCLMAVHYPAGHELTLLGLEPRWLTVKADASATMGFFPLPVESTSPPPAQLDAPRPDLAWAVLARAIRELLTGSRSNGFSTLDHLYRQTAARSPALAGLAVRNGLAAALAGGETEQVTTWLDRAAAYGSSAEVGLLCALVPSLRGELSEAVTALTRLLDADGNQGGGQWITGGGERSYRALTFRGNALARLGALDRAAADWGAALRACPDYLPPLRAIAGHRLHAAVLDRLGLRRFWRGRPAEAAALVVRAYAQSSHPEAAAAILTARPDLPVSKEVRRAIQRRDFTGTRPPRLGAAPGVRWEGPFFTASSLARVNRELATRLLAHGWDLSAIPTEPQGYAPDRDAQFGALARRLWHRPDELSVTVRHRWPPSFEPVPSGQLVVVLPWEYGPIPRRWADQMAHVAEVWVYSDWVRRGVIASGIDPERVHVVPCGFDPLIFRPGPPPHPDPDPDGAMHFLYVGGTIPRKGYDLALQAFLAEFGPDEPATLTVKDFGAASFYRGSNGAEIVRAAAAETAAVRRQVRLIDSVLSDADLARLYRSADALVAPYRGEGFCLPALEAMACGTPPILPRAGPALDYATPETALLMTAAVAPAGARVDGMELAAQGLICEVSPGALRESLRWAYAHRIELRGMGERGTAHVHAHFTWEHAARAADARLKQLLGSAQGAMR